MARTGIRAFISQQTTGEKFRRTAKRATLVCSTLCIVLTIAAVIAAVFFYNYYASVVERRVNAGFWQTRAGLYAAPYELRKDQQASPDTIVDLLRRAGYIEGATDGTTWTGSFTRAGDEIDIATNNAYNLEPETTTIKFAKNRIDEIRHNGVLAENYKVEAEMLSGRSETKRGKNHVLKFDDIPEHLRAAILAAEDQRFFDHYGIDPRGIARAIVANVRGGQVKQGGSTITQQLVKNTFLTPERSFSRKFAEAFLAVALERKMSKQDIFAVYCNEIYLGQYGASGVHGVEQAARAYFDKDLKDLSLAEAATIAAMIKNPRAFSPERNAENSAVRRDWILSRIEELQLVPASEIQLARAAEIKLAPPKRNDRSIAPYFVDAAMHDLETNFRGDYLNSNLNTRVYTTIDTQMQSIAEKAVAKHVEGLDKYFSKPAKRVSTKAAETEGIQNPKSKIQNRLQASLVALDPRTGHILAMVGGRDYRESQFNRVTDAHRQPGSAFKPIVYATAYERGMTPISVSADVPTEFATLAGKPYKPANYRNGYANTNITFKHALVKSSNVVAVRTAMDLGLGSVAAKAREFGFENVTPWPSMALGTNEVTPLQLAAAYAAFANGGKYVRPTFIDTILSGDDDMIYMSVPKEKQVIKENVAYMITDALMDVVHHGTAAKANGALGNVVFAGKTGSTKDGWFVGYTPNLVVVAWVGLDDNEDLHATGGDIAVPLWVDFMREVVKLRPEYGGTQFQMPKGMTEVTVDPETGMAAGPYCPMRETVAVPTTAAVHVRCLKHEPMTTMYAMASTNEFSDAYIAPIPTDIPATYDEPKDDRVIIEYEDNNSSDGSLTIRRPRYVPEPAPKQTSVEETFEDAYYRSTKAEKLKKPE
ncbi:MAG TPA: PBP1A family penicillin-binding protein [Pyrinomonadaceae bacterium]|nr:PBP1A family penicillin-binding protein [Pyrinomonadaceae bacterium]